MQAAAIEWLRRVQRMTARLSNHVMVMFHQESRLTLFDWSVSCVFVKARTSVLLFYNFTSRSRTWSKTDFTALAQFQLKMLQPDAAILFIHCTVLECKNPGNRYATNEPVPESSRSLPLSREVVRRGWESQGLESQAPSQIFSTLQWPRGAHYVAQTNQGTVFVCEAIKTLRRAPTDRGSGALAEYPAFYRRPLKSFSLSSQMISCSFCSLRLAVSIHKGNEKQPRSVGGPEQEAWLGYSRTAWPT